MSSGKLSLPESSCIVLIIKTVPSTWHRHHSFIDIVRSFIVTRLVTVKSGDRQVITTGDRHRLFIIAALAEKTPSLLWRDKTSLLWREKTSLLWREKTSLLWRDKTPSLLWRDKTPDVAALA